MFSQKNEKCITFVITFIRNLVKVSEIEIQCITNRVFGDCNALYFSIFSAAICNAGKEKILDFFLANIANCAV